jgi:hypothetical protein
VRFISYFIIRESRRNALDNSSSNLFTAFLAFFFLKSARLEASWISASEIPSEAFLFLLLDSKGLVFSGRITEEELSLALLFAFPFFQVLLLGALVEQSNRLRWQQLGFSCSRLVDEIEE